MWWLDSCAPFPEHTKKIRNPKIGTRAAQSDLVTFAGTLGTVFGELQIRPLQARIPYMSLGSLIRNDGVVAAPENPGGQALRSSAAAGTCAQRTCTSDDRRTDPCIALVRVLHRLAWPTVCDVKRIAMGSLPSQSGGRRSVMRGLDEGCNAIGAMTRPALRAFREHQRQGRG